MVAYICLNHGQKLILRKIISNKNITYPELATTILSKYLGDTINKAD